MPTPKQIAVAAARSKYTNALSGFVATYNAEKITARNALVASENSDKATYQAALTAASKELLTNKLTAKNEMDTEILAAE